MRVDSNNPFAVADHENKDKSGEHLQQVKSMFVTYQMNKDTSLSMFFDEDKGMNVIEDIEAI